MQQVPSTENFPQKKTQPFLNLLKWPPSWISITAQKINNQTRKANSQADLPWKLQNMTHNIFSFTMGHSHWLWKWMGQAQSRLLLCSFKDLSYTASKARPAVRIWESRHVSSFPLTACKSCEKHPEQLIKSLKSHLFKLFYWLTVCVCVCVCVCVHLWIFLTVFRFFAL